MKLIIDIPKEFETDYVANKFKDFFTRVSFAIEKGNGLCGLCGNYEMETAEMFLKAFDESVPMANIVEKLEELADNSNDHMYESYFDGKEDGIREAINIVKQEINNGN